MGGGFRRALVALAAALALADASIVALALPPLLVEFDTTITGVAAIVGVYALVLAIALIPARRGAWGMLVFAAGSLGCALAPSLGVMLAFRALQAVGAAAALLTAFEVLDAGQTRSGRRWWLGAALIGTAAGPAIGGVLTEVFDWRAIFAVQVPLALAAAWASRTPDAARGPRAATESGGAAAGAPDGALRGGAEPPATTPDPAGDPHAAAASGAAPRGAAEPPAAASGAAPRGAAEPPAAASGAAPRGAAEPPASEPPAAASGAAPWDAAPPSAVPGAAASWRSLAPLALTAAAFTAVLFLLVLELVAGFAISPLRAALGVSILPLAALAAAAIPGEPRARALAGALLLAGGAGALAFLPAPTIAWTIVPQILAGAGMGLALPALSPERNVGEAARTLVARHAGIVLVLAILAPVATARLSDATDTAILQGASLVLDAQIDPLKKLQLAPALLDDVDVSDPRGALQDAVEARRGDFADDAAVYDRLGSRLDDVVVGAIEDAFRVSYLIAAVLALLGAALLITAWRRPAIWLAAAAAAGAVVVYAVERNAEAPPPVALQDPCQERALPSTGGIAGAIQEQALKQLDQAACKTGSTREELALAIFDADRAAKFKAEYGVEPRSTISLLSLLGG